MSDPFTFTLSGNHHTVRMVMEELVARWGRTNYL